MDRVPPAFEHFHGSPNFAALPVPGSVLHGPFHRGQDPSEHARQYEYAWLAEIRVDVEKLTGSLKAEAAGAWENRPVKRTSEPEAWPRAFPADAANFAVTHSSTTPSMIIPARLRQSNVRLPHPGIAALLETILDSGGRRPGCGI